jgi:hypothetical protein
MSFVASGGGDGIKDVAFADRGAAPQGVGSLRGHTRLVFGFRDPRTDYRSRLAHEMSLLRGGHAAI